MSYHIPEAKIERSSLKLKKKADHKWKYIMTKWNYHWHNCMEHLNACKSWGIFQRSLRHKFSNIK